MGLGIGQIAGRLGTLRNAPGVGQVRLNPQDATQTSDRAVSDRQMADATPSADSSRSRVGFGEGTLSPLGAALRTIGRTIEEVRQTQPSLEEIRAQFQARAAEARRVAFDTPPRPEAEQSTPRIEGARDVQRGIPAPEPRAREFTTPVEPQVTGIDPQSGAPRPDLTRVDARDAATPDRAPDATTTTESPRPQRLDVRA